MIKNGLNYLTHFLSNNNNNEYKIYPDRLCRLPLSFTKRTDPPVGRGRIQD
ncbi:hypothetical protein Barb7_03045 [Bacteroidales bacterium Barb7]|nr:hypothetical protein Barb7_03045 [Bacteroidales bacterium Barb7]